MNETLTGGERPAGRFRIFDEASLVHAAYLDQYRLGVAARYHVQLKPHNSYVPLLRQRQPLSLPSLGSDEAAFCSIWFAAPRTHQSVATGPILIIDAELFQDGSPFVAEGDRLSNAGPDNTYAFILSAESPPAAVQVEQLDSHNDMPEGNAVNKHVLSDQECEDFLRVLAVQTPDLAEAWHQLDGGEPPVMMTGRA